MRPSARTVITLMTSLAKDEAIGKDRDYLNDLMDRSADDGRLNGYCDEYDEACHLEDQLERSQLVDGDNMVKMRGLAWGSTSNHRCCCCLLR